MFNEDEEAKMCIVAGNVESTSNDFDDEVGFSYLHSVNHAYYELLSYSSKLSSTKKILRKQRKKLLEENNALKEEVTLSKDDVKYLKQNVSSLIEKLTIFETEKEKTLFQNKKLVEDTTIVDVKRVESLRHKNNTFTKVLNRILEGSDQLRILLKDSRTPFIKRGLGFNKSNIICVDKTRKIKFIRSSSDTSTSSKNKMHASNKKGPNTIWLPKSKIISLVDQLDNKK